MKSLTIWTIVLNFFILLSAGHGIIVLGLVEIVILPGIFESPENISFALNASYEKSIFPAAYSALIGQILLILSLLTKKSTVYLQLVGLVFLWLSFYYLAHNLSNSVSYFSLLSGFPFLIVSIKLAMHFYPFSSSSMKDGMQQ